MKRWVLSGLLLALGGFFLTLLPVSGRSQDQPSHAKCPPLPEQGQAGTVSIYAVKALDVPGVVCVRAINGISPAIGLSGGPFWLQRWNKGAFEDFYPSGAPVGGVLARWELPVGKTVDRDFFAGQPVPSGRYRVCLRYAVALGSEEQIACSEEFSLP